MFNNNITCPNCGHQFPIEHSIREEIQQEFRNKWNQAQKKKDDENAQILQRRIQEEKQKVEETLRKSIGHDFENKMKVLQQSLIDNEERLKEARKKELEFLQKEHALKTKEEELQITLQRQMLNEREKLKEQLLKEESEKLLIKEQVFELKLREKEKQIEDQKKLVDEMKRKVDQGSMQLQGEVQELLLEELLKNSFPFDVIEEVGKGIKGADCIQNIRNNIGQICGKIIYESKRTKDFSKEWIEKLKTDMRSLDADIGIIVTQAMPKDMDNFGEKDGIWICSFEDVKSLSYILRDCIIKVYTQTKTQQNKGDKMHLLYDYLTSSTFAEQWSAIKEGFHAMKISIQKEREAMERLWKAREKQLEKVLLSTAHMKGSIEGIAGTEVIDLNFLDDSTNNILSISPS